uniref:Zinc finger protein n=1 Tax=Loa loa TaxID=7209 RepID=A0A1I7VT53_LOALO
MGSQINIRTGKEYADEELGLLKTQPILQNYEQLKVSETAQPILLESTVTCNEIEKAKVAEESVTDHNRLQAMDRNSNSRNISHLRTTGATHTNEPVKNKEDEATQTSYSKMTHCSKPIHQQVRPESNFIKANVYSCQKCICKGIREQSSRNRRCVRSSTVNAIKSHAWNQMLSASNHHRKAKCRHSIHIIGGPSHQNRPKHDVLKCYGCGRLTLRKCCNGRSIGVHHCSACHLHSNGKNHSSGFRHTYYRKHH